MTITMKSIFMVMLTSMKHVSMFQIVDGHVDVDDVNGTMTLSCRSDSSWEFCVWSKKEHPYEKSLQCHLEWKRAEVRNSS